MANTIITLGKTEIIDTGTETHISCNGTVRFIIDNVSGTVTAGAVDGTGDGSLIAGTLTSENNIIMNAGRITLANVGEGVVGTEDKAKIYLSGSKLVINYMNGGVDHFYYADLDQGTNITELIYSATDPA